MGTPALSIWRAGAVMTAGTALSRLTGLVRVVAMTYALGVTGTRLADTYNLANVTPNIIYELFLGGIFTAVFVPVLVRLRDAERAPDGEGGRGAEGSVSALVTVSLLALAALSVAAAVAAPFIMRLYTFRVPDPEARAAQLELATFLLRFFAPQILFYGLTAVGQALMNVRGVFGPPMFAPVLNNVVVTATLLVYAGAVGDRTLDLSFGAKVLLGGGTTAGVVLQGLVLLPALRGLRFKPGFRDPSVARVLRLSAFVVGYVLINQAGLWVVLALANRVTGGVTAWTVAFMFFLLPHSLFTVSLLTALQPDLARTAQAGRFDDFRERFTSGVRAVTFLMLPAAAGYAVLAGPLTQTLVGFGAGAEADAEAVAEVLRVLAVGLVFFSIFQLLTRCFYALSDTRTPTMLNAVAVGVNIVLAIAAFERFGMAGLAGAHAAAYGTGAVLLAVVLGRRIGGLGLTGSIGALGRMAACTVVMAVAVALVRDAVGRPPWAVVSIAVVGGTILYAVLSLAVRVPEARMVLRWRAGRRGDAGQVSSWLVRLVLAIAIGGFVVIEGGSVVFNRLQAADIASQAAAQGGIAYYNSGSVDGAENRAREFVEDKGAQFVALAISENGRTVFVTVRKRAPTVVVHRVGALEDLTVAKVTESAPMRQ